MPIATLSIDVEARLAKLEEGMDKAARISQRSADEIKGSFDGLKNIGIGLGASIAAAFSVSAVSAFVRATVGSIDVMNDLKDATGASIENISALEDVGARTGTSFESVSSTLIKFNKVLSEAKGGSEVTAILTKLGLSAEELKRIDPAEALRQTAVALSRYADDGDKARIVQELFGKSIAEAAPFLADLAKQGKLNATVTTQQAEEAEKFNQQLAALQKNATDSARSIVGQLIPALNNIFDAYQKLGGVKGIALAVLGLDEQGQTASNAKALQAEIIRTTDVIERMQTELDRNPDNEFLKTRIDKARTRLGGLIKDASAASDKLKALADATDGGRNENFSNEGRNAPKASIGSIPEKDKKGRALKTPKPDFVGPELPESLKAAFKAVDSVDSAKIADLQDQLRELISIRAVSGGGATDEAILKITEELEKFSPAAVAAAEEKKRLDTLLAATPTAKLEETREDMERLAKAFEAGQISAEQFAEAAQTRLGTLPDLLKDTTEKMSTLSEQAARNIQDSLGGTIKSTLKGDFDDVSRSWGNLLLDLASQALAAKVGEALLGDFGKTGNVGGFFGSVLSLFSARGNVFAAPGGVQAFANGGIVGGPTLFGMGGGRTGLMGEAGPEAVVPLKRGKDGKLGISGGGSANINQVVNVGQGVSRGEVAQAVAQANQALLESLRAQGRL